MTMRDYNHSRPLDVHKWSNYSEVNTFIDKLYDNNIKNISLFEPISNHQFQKKLNLSDSALITLSNKNKTPIIPGKFNFYCLNSKNITSIVNKESDLHEIIKTNKLGFSTHNQNNCNIVKFLKKVIRNKELNKYNKNAFKFAKKKFDISHLIKFIENI